MNIINTTRALTKLNIWFHTSQYDFENIALKIQRVNNWQISILLLLDPLGCWHFRQCVPSSAICWKTLGSIVMHHTSHSANNQDGITGINQKRSSHSNSNGDKVLAGATQLDPKLSSVYSSLTVHTLENTMQITKIPYFSIGFIYFLKFGISTSSFITAENHQIICFRVITDEGNADRLVISAIKEHRGKYFGVSGRVWKNLCWRRCTKKETAPHRHSLTHEVTYKLWIAMQAILKLVRFEIWPILVLTIERANKNLKAWQS